MDTIIIFFRDDTLVELAKVSREGLSSCDAAKQYRVEWNDIGSTASPLLTLSEFEPENRTWSLVVAARYEGVIPLIVIRFCQVTDLRLPVITRKFPMNAIGYILQTKMLPRD